MLLYDLTGIAHAVDGLVYAELGAEWERKHGALFLRFRAVVPVQADFRVIGFLPMFTVGRSFMVP